MIDGTQPLPDDLTPPLVWSGLIVNLWGLFTPLASAVIGAVAGYHAPDDLLAVQAHTWKGGNGLRLVSSCWRRLAWLGWKMLPLIVLLSSVVGAVIGLALIAIKGRAHDVPIPFGPFLAIAGAIALFFGPALNKLYLP
jgi:leader peptidase (prepilin peptidase)/N-methyltransferase